MTVSLRDHSINKFWRRMVAGAATFALAGMSMFVGTQEANAELVKYQIFNHPDGTQIQSDVDTDGYVLRLDLDYKNEVNTFNANHSELYFAWDNDYDKNGGYMYGYVTHNESGSTSGYDSNDDVWKIEGYFKYPQFHDEDSEASEWWGSNDDDDVYNDMVADLYNDANEPDRAVERNKAESDDVARIYWKLTDVKLTLVEDNAGGQQYEGPTKWDEVGPDLFFQYNWRLWDHDTDAVAAAGWLEKSNNKGQKGTNDFLFIFDHGSPVPEPASAALLGLGSFMLLGRRRRNRK